jgi:hypothetical protein
MRLPEGSSEKVIKKLIFVKAKASKLKVCGQNIKKKLKENKRKFQILLYLPIKCFTVEPPLVHKTLN